MDKDQEPVPEIDQLLRLDTEITEDFLEFVSAANEPLAPVKHAFVTELAAWLDEDRVRRQDVTLICPVAL